MVLVEMTVLAVILSSLLNLLVIVVLINKGSNMHCFDMIIISMASSDIFQVIGT